MENIKSRLLNLVINEPITESDKKFPICFEQFGSTHGFQLNSLTLNIPKTATEFVGYVNALRAHLNYNDDGVPLEYMLEEIASLDLLLKSKNLSKPKFNWIEGNLAREAVQMFDNFFKAQRIILEAYTKIKLESDKISDSIAKEMLQNEISEVYNLIESRKNQWEANEYMLKIELFDFRTQKNKQLLNQKSEATKDSKNEPEDGGIQNKIKEFYQSTLPLEGAQNQLKKYDYLREKVEYFSKLCNKNALIFSNNNDRFNQCSEIIKKNKVYIFSCSWKAKTGRFGVTSRFFLKLLEKGQICMYIDIDSLKDKFKDSMTNVITLLSNGKEVCNNVIDYVISKSAIPTVIGENFKASQHTFIKKCFLELPCPSSSLFGGNCPSDAIKWHCNFCFSQIQYGFDDFIYCNCGRASLSTIKFHCSQADHKNQHVNFEKGILEEQTMKMKPTECYNILVIGESGAGKSTWINAMANYLSLPNFETALQKDPICIMPYHTFYTDSEGNNHEVRKGFNTDLYQTGQSCTQDPASYVFEFGGKQYRFIDTPGLDDTRGLEQDRINCDKILTFLKSLNELHCICVLLHANKNRLTNSFKYTLKEILLRLHQSAAKNIVFCLTYAVSCKFRPGSVMEPLTAFVNNELPENNIHISLGREAVYCVDNDSFGFFCLRSDNVKFDDDEIEEYESTWKKSKKETQRLLDHVIKLEPHKTLETTSLNEAREIILTIWKPVVDIAENIFENIQYMRQKLESGEPIDHLEEIAIEVCPLQDGRTVCRNSKCINKAIIRNTNLKTVNFKICHEKCNMFCRNKGGYDYVPDSSVQSCWVFRSWLLVMCNENCSKCNCSWTEHFHITFEQKKILKKVEEESSKLNVKEAMKFRIEQYENEAKRMVEIFVQFAAFLKKNSIIPINDAFEEQLKKAIETEESATENGNKNIKLAKLKEFQNKYASEKNKLEEALKNPNSNTVVPEASKIEALKEELFCLKITGKSIENLYMNTIEGRHANFNFSETVYSIGDDLSNYIQSKSTKTTKSNEQECQISLLDDLIEKMNLEKDH